MQFRKRSAWGALGSLLMGVIVTGCNSGGIPLNPQQQADKAKWDGVASLLSQKTGDSYAVVKGYSNYTGIAVLQDTTTGEYFSANFSVYTPGMTYDQYIAATGGADSAFVHNLTMVDNSHWTGVNNPPEPGIDPVWIVDYEYAGQGYVFEDGSPRLKDLETWGAELQANELQKTQAALVSQFGLSANRAHDVAQLMASWSALSKRREMTAADLKDFSTDLLGADLATFEKAFAQAQKQGDSKTLDGLVNVAARTNGISVEHARAILNTFLSQ